MTGEKREYQCVTKKMFGPQGTGLSNSITIVGEQKAVGIYSQAAFSFLGGWYLVRGRSESAGENRHGVGGEAST
jgi:hypothetical protein